VWWINNILILYIIEGRTYCQVLLQGNKEAVSLLKEKPLMLKTTCQAIKMLTFHVKE
jgi:hypothetical protein